MSGLVTEKRGAIQYVFDTPALQRNRLVLTPEMLCGIVALYLRTHQGIDPTGMLWCWAMSNNAPWLAIIKPEGTT